MRIYCGSIMSSENRSSVQPRNDMPYGSSAALPSPHVFIRSRAHSAAWRRLSDPVSLGPYTSLSQLSVSITCEFWNPSTLMAATTASSTRSADVRPLTGARARETMISSAPSWLVRVTSSPAGERHLTLKRQASLVCGSINRLADAVTTNR